MNQLIKKSIERIESVKVQGASSVCREVLNSLPILLTSSIDTIRKAGATQLNKPVHQYINNLARVGKMLAEVRPTEPLARNSVKFVINYLKIKAKGKTAKQAQKILNQAIAIFLQLLKNQEKKIAETGSCLIKSGMHVMTHCHSSCVEGILVNAAKNKNFKVYITETRPLYQGRITARHLLKKKIKTTMVVDSAAEFLISRSSGKGLMMEMIFLGADSITSGGSVINKIGSFGISQVAHFEKVPLYVATSLLKTDPETFLNKYVALELRDRKEIWPEGPKGLKIINFSFDRIPAQFITGIICEFGIVKPKDVAKLVAHHYPWIFREV